ncbi:hypothetical protein C5167_047282 [Papaver somniferum]|uniref:Uncharacterized protein n=1 Tax=Papaver somniferum TaxID=3469 RepID=A0A4Y7LIR3_PAPSO|nr:hypothetical protein C5167_047282 [Papaver somniferum]
MLMGFISVLCKINCCTPQLQAICQECGESDDMGAEILIPCKMRKPPAKYRTPMEPTGFLMDAFARV